MRTLLDSVLEALTIASQHNGNVMVKPEVILWPDPDSQWKAVVSILKNRIPAFLTYGGYDPSDKTGPANWIKCMVARQLPEANWKVSDIPIIYLPAISKNDLRRVSEVGMELQPLVEYQYTGTMFTQVNGREWTVLAFMENALSGLGLRVSQDTATKEALIQALPYIFEDSTLHYPGIVNADFLNSVMFPDAVSNVLKWICQGDAFIQTLPTEKQPVFSEICRTRFEFEPDQNNIREIVLKLGSQKNAWKQVWQLYASAPHRYPEVEALLRMAKPDDMGVGMFAIPEESWPQINEEAEHALRKALSGIAKADIMEGLDRLRGLFPQHNVRTRWVWSELGYAPLANALIHLIEMASICSSPFPSTTIEEIKRYYVGTGIHADQAMRNALACTKAQKDKDAVKAVITLFYTPWLESLTKKFQTVVDKTPAVFQTQKSADENDQFILFVDAFRYELACEFIERITGSKYKVTLDDDWVGIPSVTATSKPAVMPVHHLVNGESTCAEFRPQLNSGKDLQTGAFRDAMASQGFELFTLGTAIDPEKKYWQEIGKIDSSGHEEQSNIVKRIDELFDQIEETLEVAFEAGAKRVRIVTDHGWLLLPNGLPKTDLNKNLTETKWGRCALIKEGANTDLLHLPWRWNPSVFIAYAPGISFFRKGEEYAHGGISLHECLIPVISVEKVAGAEVFGKIEDFKWTHLVCRITTAQAGAGYTLDIRTKYSDPKSSVVARESDTAVVENRATLMVEDEYESHSAVVVLLDQDGRIMDKKPTVVGA
jgi:hypothetical protein